MNCSATGVFSHIVIAFPISYYKRAFQIYIKIFCSFLQKFCFRLSAAAIILEFVRAVIKLLKEIDCKIYLGDGPSVFGGNIEDIVKVYERTGIKKIAEQENEG